MTNTEQTKKSNTAIFVQSNGLTVWIISWERYRSRTFEKSNPMREVSQRKKKNFSRDVRDLLLLITPVIFHVQSRNFGKIWKRLSKEDTK
jgi:tRNA(Phe) wybutosine-synthesizing methylase Tyw3